MEKIDRKAKWRNTFLNESNIDEYMQDLYNDTKGQYVSQGVSFNKDDAFQMGILKEMFLSPSSFSNLVKHLLHDHFKNQGVDEFSWKPNRSDMIETPSVQLTVEPEIEDDSATADMSDGKDNEEAATIIKNDVVEEKIAPKRKNNLSGFTAPIE